MTELKITLDSDTNEPEGKNQEPGAPEPAETEKVSEKIVIGISKFVQHPALDAVEQGIMDELAELGWDNITYDLQNANADANTSAQIATKFKSSGVDLAVGIATPTAQSIVDRVDAFHISTDNTVVSALNSLADVALKNKKLTIFQT